MRECVSWEENRRLALLLDQRARAQDGVAAIEKRFDSGSRYFLTSPVEGRAIELSSAASSDFEKRRSSDSVRSSLNGRNEREWSIRMMSQLSVM